MKQITKKVVGVILIILGLAALLTPLTPGSWLIPIGLELLGLRILLQDRLLRWARARPNSKLARVVCRLLCIREGDSLVKRWWRRLRGRKRDKGEGPSAGASGE